MSLAEYRNARQPTYAGRSGARWEGCKNWFKDNYDWICHICGQEIPDDVDPRSKMSWTLDHLIPLVEVLALGLDPYDHSNLLPAHRSCNSRKGSQVRRPDMTTKVSRVL